MGLSARDQRGGHAAMSAVVLLLSRRPTLPILGTPRITVTDPGWHDLGQLRRATTRSIGKREGFLVVTFGWLFLTLSGTLPYLFIRVHCQLSRCVLRDRFRLSPPQGHRILIDIEVVPKSVLFWRSFTQWVGGMGIIVLTIADPSHSGHRWHAVVHGRITGSDSRQDCTRASRKPPSGYGPCTCMLTIGRDDPLMFFGLDLFEV